MNYLKITHQPIQYQYEVEPARLEMQQGEKSYAKITNNKSSLQTKSKDIKVNISTKDAYESMNMRPSSSWAKEYGNRGIQTAQQYTGDTVQFGNQMQQIDKGVTIAQIVKSKLIQQIPTAYQTFIPSVGPEISWEPAQLDVQYDPGSLEMDWQIMRNAMDYIPGKFSFIITQYPRVMIEYMGGIHYVPPSADPEYQDPDV